MGIKDQTVKDVNVFMFFVQLLEKTTRTRNICFPFIQHKCDNIIEAIT